MASKQTTASGGIGFFGLLTIVFIVLKLTGNIDWSWWWVLASLWMPFAFFIFVLIFCLIMYLLFQRPKKRRIR